MPVLRSQLASLSLLLAASIFPIHAADASTASSPDAVVDPYRSDSPGYTDRTENPGYADDNPGTDDDGIRNGDEDGNTRDDADGDIILTDGFSDWRTSEIERLTRLLADAEASAGLTLLLQDQAADDVAARWQRISALTLQMMRLSAALCDEESAGRGNGAWAAWIRGEMLRNSFDLGLAWHDWFEAEQRLSRLISDLMYLEERIERLEQQIRSLREPVIS